MSPNRTTNSSATTPYIEAAAAAVVPLKAAEVALKAAEEEKDRAVQESARFVEELKALQTQLQAEQAKAKTAEQAKTAERVVYTVMTGTRDTQPTAVCKAAVEDGVDFVLMTDNKRLLQQREVEGWTTLSLTPELLLNFRQ